MRFSSMMRGSAAALVVLGTMTPGMAQTFAAVTGAEPVIGTPVPRTSHVAVPGKHRKAEDKLLFGRVRDGVYTVDGMVAKVQLNYDVNGVNFLYLFAPGIGTAVVSVTADPDAVVSEASYKDDELSFTAGDHRFHLTGVTLASDKGAAPAHLFVKLDRSAWRLSRRPMVGFGDTAALPYLWPGALPAANVSQAEELAPPVPVSLLPSARPVVPAVSEVPALSPVALR